MLHFSGTQEHGDLEMAASDAGEVEVAEVVMIRLLHMIIIRPHQKRRHIIHPKHLGRRQHNKVGNLDSGQGHWGVLRLVI